MRGRFGVGLPSPFSVYWPNIIASTRGVPNPRIIEFFLARPTIILRGPHHSWERFLFMDFYMMEGGTGASSFDS